MLTDIYEIKRTQLPYRLSTLLEGLLFCTTTQEKKVRE